ncbi:MAG: hypothetical protein U0736_26855 [Gemmataceae bacterium]
MANGSCEYNGGWRVWDIATGQVLKSGTVKPPTYDRCAWAVSDRELLLLTRNQAQLYDLQADRVSHTCRMPQTTHWQVRVLAGGKRVLMNQGTSGQSVYGTLSYNTGLIVWDLTDGKLHASWRTPSATQSMSGHSRRPICPDRRLRTRCGRDLKTLVSEELLLGCPVDIALSYSP